MIYLGNVCLCQMMLYFTAYEKIPTPTSTTDDNKKWYIIGFTIGGVVLLAFIIWLILFIYCKCKRGDRKERGSRKGLPRSFSGTGRGYESESGDSQVYNKTQETFRVTNDECSVIAINGTRLTHSY